MAYWRHRPPQMQATTDQVAVAPAAPVKAAKARGRG